MFIYSESVHIRTVREFVCQYDLQVLAREPREPQLLLPVSSRLLQHRTLSALFY